MIAPIPGFPSYAADSDGHIKRIGGRLLKPYPNKWGYSIVTLSESGVKKRASVHRLIASTFIGKSQLHVDHVNCIRSDNRLENLRYVTPSQNNRRVHEEGRFRKDKITPNYEMKLNRAIMILADKKSGVPTGIVAKRYGVSAPLVCDIVSGRCWPEAKAVNGGDK